MLVVSVVLVVFVLLVAFVAVRWVRRKKASNEEAGQEGLASRSVLRPVLEQGATGMYRGIEYRVEVSPQGVATLSFALSEPLVNPLEVDAREDFEPISELTRGLDIRALIAMGANYIDIGATGPHACVAFPPGSDSFERTEIERILSHLLRLRDLSSD